MLALAFVAVCGSLVGVIYAGSSERLATGVHIAGIDVGGRSIADARRLLETRAARLRHVPVVFVSGRHRWKITPARLGVRVDWDAAVDAARDRGDGFRPLRGLRRLGVRVFGAQVSPPVQAWDAALRYQLSLFARVIDRRHRDAALRLRGLRVAVVSGRDGRRLDRKDAGTVMVHALASLTRKAPVELPVRVDSQRVIASDLADATEEARTALSAPIRLVVGRTRYRIPRWRIARLLQLPAHGSSELTLGGRGERRYFAKLAHTVGKPPRDATWSVTAHGIRVVPAKGGLLMEREPTEKALLAAVLSHDQRVAEIRLRPVPPSRTTEQARSMGITGLVGGYSTFYGGDPNRIHNVQLVAHLIDRTLIAPGATFSFNATTGDRNEAKGFLEAPVIINGELQTGLGGGVCQVSTTVFNAAYEGGLAITARTNHALYIDHYPLGRDATVNYPDTDLKFVNDTDHWLFLRTFVGSSSLTVNLYGTPVHRRVTTETQPLTTAGSVPVKKVEDPELLKGQTVVTESGSAPLQTSVHRRVYSPSGKLLHDNVWSSYYVGETRVIKIGTKLPPPPPPPPPPAQTTTGEEPTTTGPSATTTTTTTTETTPP